MRKILKNIILTILIMILTYVGYARYIRKDAVVKIGGYGILIVLTNSMDPIIKENALIVIKELPNYELNDIVTYRDAQETLITHRILQIDEYSFIARGDNNSVADENTSIDNIEGKVIYHSKVLGIFILYYLKVFVFICLLLWMVFWLKTKLTKEEKNENNKVEEK